MTPVGSIFSAPASQLTRLDGPQTKGLPITLSPGTAAPVPAADSFGSMIDGLVGMVNTKQAESSALTKKVLLGESDQIHQSVIAMQEAGVAFSLMVEVRNKLVESYQELMRLQV